MERRFRITVDGHPYTVTVEELTDGATFAPHAAGTPATPVASSAHALAGGAMAAGPGQESDAGPGTPAPLQPGLQSPAAAAGPGDVLATLGGVVQSVAVTLGQVVQQGDVVVVLESMKMNSPMVAAREGRITQLCVQTGDPVQAGQLLATIG